jgi:superfamily II DNA/RNA helicase
MVIHVEQPMDSSTYVHRSGRTGRAGQKGQSVLLVPKSRAQRTTRMFRMLSKPRNPLARDVFQPILADTVAFFITGKLDEAVILFTL